MWSIGPGSDASCYARIKSGTIHKGIVNKKKRPKNWWNVEKIRKCELEFVFVDKRLLRVIV